MYYSFSITVEALGTYTYPPPPCHALMRMVRMMSACCLLMVNGYIYLIN